MPQESFLKCPCKNCAGNVEFPAEGIGQTILCPHCGEPTELVVDPEIIPNRQRSFSKRAVLLALLIPLALVAAMAVGIFAAKEKPDSTPSPQIKMAPVEIISETKSDASPRKIKQRKKASVPKPAADWNGLVPGEVALEKTGSRLIYAVGSIRNDSDRQRFGVTVELDLFDSKGAKVGSSTDYVPVIEPAKEWNFKALVTDPKAGRAEITAIKEN